MGKCHGYCFTGGGGVPYWGVLGRNLQKLGPGRNLQKPTLNRYNYGG